MKAGGHLLVTFKTAFTDEYLKVYSNIQPSILSECLGVSYQQFTYPQQVRLHSKLFTGTQKKEMVQEFMELLIPTTAKVLASYAHPAWKNYAAVTGNNYGKGYAVYVGCMTSNTILEQILFHVLENTNLLEEREIVQFPVIVRKGINDFGKTVQYYLNYSWEKQTVLYTHKEGMNLLTQNKVSTGTYLEIEPWDLQIIES